MKRTLPWVIGIGCAGLALAFVLRGRSPSDTMAVAQQGGEAAAPQAPAAEQPAAPEKVVFTFDADEKMNEFTTVWQQRQAMILRMTVLQSFWNEEQVRLAQLNKQLSDDYKVDVSKNYYLDGQRRVLIEREAPPQVPQTASPTQPSQ
jgi:hypothetical protein